MKRKILIIILFVILAVFIGLSLLIIPQQLKGIKEYNNSKNSIISESNEDTITIMSANIRTVVLKDKYEKSWVYRAPYLKMNIESANPDIISFQEVGRIHMGYLTKILSDYDYILKYRDLNPLGEGCPIFYKKDKFELIKKGFFWLSDTPDKMSKDEDASCNRICSYVILKDKISSKEIIVLNTHLDHISEDARIRGINLVLSKIKEFGFEDKASVLMGDMNDFVGSSTINALFEVFDDGYTIAENKNGVEEIHSTYQGYGTKNEDRIDFFGISKTGIIVNSYNCITTTYSNEEYETIYPSDHFPIVINITLE